MTTINSLPNEALDAILRFRAAEPVLTTGPIGELQRVIEMYLPDDVRQPCYNNFHTNDITALLPVLKVCRRWRDVGLPLVWANVGANLRPFSTALRFSGFGLHLRSLTLKGPLNRDSHGLYTMPDPYHTFSQFNKVLRDLAFVLDSLSLLHTCSISFPLANGTGQGSLDIAHRHRPADDALVSERTLHRLLSNLPPSVENLEVDTGLSGAFGLGSNHSHLCPVLHAIFPRMKRVKLHIAKVCPLLFEAEKTSNVQLVVFPKLEGLFIDAAYLLDEKSCLIQMADLAKKGVDRFAPKLRFLRAALVAAGNNTFPTLKQFSVFDKMDHRNNTNPVFYEATIKRDENTPEAHISPVIQDGGFDPLTRDAVRYTDAQGAEKEFGQRSRLMQPTGGPAWIESAGGARSPRPYDSDNSAGKVIYKWRNEANPWNEHVARHVASLSVMLVIAAVLEQRRQAAAPDVPLSETMSVTAYETSDDRFVRVIFHVGCHLLEAEALEGMNGRLRLPVHKEVMEEVHNDWEMLSSTSGASGEDQEFDSD